MTDIEENQAVVPALPMIRLEPDGRHWLAGSRCQRCSVTVSGERMVCPACGGRDTLDHIHLSLTGRLYNYTIVHRSFPGVSTPFVSAVVDLTGGGTLKGVLLGVEPDPARIAYDAPVEVTFRDTGQKDKEGRSFISYYFVEARGKAS